MAVNVRYQIMRDEVFPIANRDRFEYMLPKYLVFAFGITTRPAGRMHRSDQSSPRSQERGPLRPLR
jgi:hypothetical protein